MIKCVFKKQKCNVNSNVNYRKIKENVKCKINIKNIENDIILWYNQYKKSKHRLKKS